MSLVEQAIKLDLQSGKRIKAKLPDDKGRLQPYPRFVRLLERGINEETDDWVASTVFRFWYLYLFPIIFGDQNSVGNRIRTSTDKMETVSQMVTEWIPELQRYIETTQKDLNITGPSSSQEGETAYIDN